LDCVVTHSELDETSPTFPDLIQQPQLADNPCFARETVRPSLFGRFGLISGH
jgi:hypothetical protein